MMIREHELIRASLCLQLQVAIPKKNAWSRPYGPGKQTFKQQAYEIRKFAVCGFQGRSLSVSPSQRSQRKVGC